MSDPEGLTPQSEHHMDQTLRRVAVIGGVRIPFCRSNTLYADQSNLEMLTATLNGLVDKYELEGRAHRRGGRRRGRHRTPRTGTWRARRCSAPSSRPRRPASPDPQACGTSLQAAIMIAAKIATGQIESGIAMGSDTTSDAPIVVQAEVRAPPGRGAERQVDRASG